MPLSKWTCFIGILVCAIIGQAWSSEDAQREFERAKSYTIKVRSSVAIPFESDTKGTGTGAGFIVDLGRKWAVTNAHVVTRSKAILQVSSFGTEFGPAKAVYIDPVFDIAVIELENVKNLTEASLECSHSAFTGLPVGAFGHPWDHSYTGTKGIVSGRTSELSKTFGDFLQTDAPINPGNSGGPLINLRTGKVIGINTAGLTQAQNMNYAVPAEEICSIVNLLKKGIDPSPPDAPFSFFKDSDDKNTLKIAQIKDAGKLMGAEIGDVIIAAGKHYQLVENEAQLRNALRGELANATLLVKRHGKEIALQGPVYALPAVLSKKGVYFSGLLLRKAYNPLYKELFGQNFVMEFDYADAGGVGESRGITSGDILVSIDGKEFKDTNDVFQTLINAKKSKDTVHLQFKRLSFEGCHVFTYRERTVPIDDVRWIDFEEHQPKPLIQHFAGQPSVADLK